MTERLLFDAELAWKVYDYIEAHPEEWNQRVWCEPITDDDRTQIKCGTKACFAGTMALMTAPQGTKFYDDALQVKGSNLYSQSYLSYAVDALSKGTTASFDMNEELSYTQHALRREIEAMFGEMNTLEDIKYRITLLANTYPSV